MTQPRDWDDAYGNMKHTPGAEALPAQWAADAMAYRKVFVHGGYWMKFAKSDWTHFAAGAVAHGWAVCLPQYPRPRCTDC